MHAIINVSLAGSKELCTTVAPILMLLNYPCLQFSKKLQSMEEPCSVQVLLSMFIIGAGNGKR